MFFRKPTRPSLPLRKAPPLTPALSPQERGRKPPYSVLGTAALYGWRTIKGLRQVLRAGTAWGGVAVVWEKGCFLGVKGMAGDVGGEC